MFGYLRVLEIRVAILTLLGADSAMAVDWLYMDSLKEGKAFYQNHHRTRRSTN